MQHSKFNTTIGRLKSLNLGSAHNIYLKIGNAFLDEKYTINGDTYKAFDILYWRIINDIQINYNSEKATIFKLGYITSRIKEKLVIIFENPDSIKQTETVDVYIDDFEILNRLMEQIPNFNPFLSEFQNILELLKSRPQDLGVWRSISLSYKGVYNKICSIYGLSGSENSVYNIDMRNQSKDRKVITDEERHIDNVVIMLGSILERLQLYLFVPELENKLLESSKRAFEILTDLGMQQFILKFKEVVEREKRTIEQRSIILDEIREINKKLYHRIGTKYGSERTKLMLIGAHIESLYYKTLGAQMHENDYEWFFCSVLGQKNQASLILSDIAMDLEAIHKHLPLAQNMRKWAERMDNGHFCLNDVDEFRSEIAKWTYTLWGHKEALIDYAITSLTANEMRNLIDLGIHISPFCALGDRRLTLEKGTFSLGFIVADLMASLKLSEPLFLLVPILKRLVTERSDKPEFQDIGNDLFQVTFSSIGKQYGQIGLSVFAVGRSIGNLWTWMGIAEDDEKFITKQLSTSAQWAELEQAIGEIVRTLSNLGLDEIAEKVESQRKIINEEGLNIDKAKEICILCDGWWRETKEKLSTDGIVKFKPIL